MQRDWIALGEPGLSQYEDLVRMLDVLVANRLKAIDKCRILEEDYDIQMTAEIGEEVDRMCNLSQGILEEGYRQGRELAEIECIRNLMQYTGWSQTDAFKALKVPHRDWSTYAAVLERTVEDER